MWTLHNLDPLLDLFLDPHLDPQFYSFKKYGLLISLFFETLFISIAQDCITVIHHILHYI